jgi:hypothetical protein
MRRHRSESADDAQTIESAGKRRGEDVKRCAKKASTQKKTPAAAAREKAVGDNATKNETSKKNAAGTHAAQTKRKFAEAFGNHDVAPRNRSKIAGRSNSARASRNEEREAFIAETEARKKAESILETYCGRDKTGAAGTANGNARGAQKSLFGSRIPFKIDRRTCVDNRIDTEGESKLFEEAEEMEREEERRKKEKKIVFEDNETAKGADNDDDDDNNDDNEEKEDEDEEKEREGLFGDSESEGALEDDYDDKESRDEEDCDNDVDENSRTKALISKLTKRTDKGDVVSKKTTTTTTTTTTRGNLDYGKRVTAGGASAKKYPASKTLKMRSPERRGDANRGGGMALETIILDDERRGTKIGGAYDNTSNAYGGYVGVIPTGMESEMTKLAKKAHSTALLNAAVNNILTVKDSAYCGDISSNPLTNDNYVDKSKVLKVKCGARGNEGRASHSRKGERGTNRNENNNNNNNNNNADNAIVNNVDDVDDNDGDEDDDDETASKERREEYYDKFISSYMEADFEATYAPRETIELLKQYIETEITLEKDNARKNLHAKTQLDYLPLVSSAYIGTYLREPIEGDPHIMERRCLAENNCVSLFLYDFVTNNPLYVAKNADATTTATTTTNAATIKARQEKRDVHPKNEKKGKFILREFLLPDQQEQFDADVSLGISPKEALEKIDRQHCILCNRYITNLCAVAMASGSRPAPTNPIQNHRNFFNSVGEYPSSSALILSREYCGVIGGIVGFLPRNYALGLIEPYVYNTTSSDEISRGLKKPDVRINLRTWIEIGLVESSNKHEGGKSNRPD